MPVGAVYLLKASTQAEDPKKAGADTNSTEESQMEPEWPVSVIAYNTVCPHLGCFVDYRKKEQDFFCPCHDSNFDLNSKLVKGVSPRAMDTLEVDQEKLKNAVGYTLESLQEGQERLYNNVHDVLTNGAERLIQPWQSRKQVAVMEECHRASQRPRCPRLAAGPQAARTALAYVQLFPIPNKPRSRCL